MELMQGCDDVTHRAQSAVEVRPLEERDTLDHDVCRRLAREKARPGRHLSWPRAALIQGSVTLVGVVGGLVVGRAVLEAPYQPYCELVNLCVRPDYRGQGVATAIVRESVRRARSLGLKYMVLQESLEGPAAHGIYVKAGFLPATAGEMRRMIRLLDAPLVSMLLREHPGAAFTSEPAHEFGSRWWRLAWRAAEQAVALYLHGGSCQSDSNGLQPVVQACEYCSPEVSFEARVDTESEVARGRATSLVTTIRNAGADCFTGVVRALLVPDTEVEGPASVEAARVELQPGTQAEVPIPVRIGHEFACDHQRFACYPSAPFTVELCWEGGSVLLSAAVKVT